MGDIRSDKSPNSKAIHPGGLSLQGPHRVGAFALCPQLEAFAHELQLRCAVEKPATGIGVLLHVGLAYRYALMLPKEAQPSWLVYPDAMTAIAVCGENQPEYAQEAQRVLAWYYHHYNVNTWTPVLVEHQFVTQIDQEPYSARIDLLVIENGEYVLVDHKSISKLRGSIGHSYRSDRQMMTQLALARLAGYDVKRIVINAMTKEYPRPNFMRYDVPLSGVAYDHFLQDTRYYLNRLRQTRIDYPDPWKRPRNTDACVRKYGVCDYEPICTQGQTPDVLAEFVTKRH